MRLRVGDWEVEPRLDEIRRNGERVKLGPRTMALLVHLAERQGEVISPEELLNEVWRGVVVAPSSVYEGIAVLRRALQDDGEHSRYIVNVPRKGYRLIAPVIRIPETPASPQPGDEAADGTAGATTPEQAKRSRNTLRILIAGALLVAAIAAMLAPESIRQRLFGSAQPERSVAVLPFLNLNRNASDAYLADGLTEDMLQTLGRLPGLQVAARTSSFAFRERRQDVREVAAALSVRFILDGSVRRVDDRIRINAQLVDGATGFQLWSDRYDRPVNDVLGVQEEIALSVARSLEIVLTREMAARLSRRGSVDPLAFDAYLKGRSYWSERSATSLRSAAEHYELAISRDPTYAPFHVAVAELAVVLPLYGIEPSRTAFPRARAAALKATSLDPDLAEARATLAVIRYQYEWNWTDAESEFRRSLTLNPSYATARQWYAEFLSYQGRTEEAEAQIAVARDVDPLSPTIATLQGSPALWSRAFGRAENAYRSALVDHPRFGLAHYSLALSLLGQHRYQEAIDAFGHASDNGLREEFVLPSLVHAQVAFGQRDLARANLDRILAAEKGHYISPYKIAVMWAALGDREQAMKRLLQARDEHDDRLVLLGFDPLLDSLRGDERFRALLHEIHAIEFTGR